MLDDNVWDALVLRTLAKLRERNMTRATAANVLCVDVQSRGLARELVEDLSQPVSELAARGNQVFLFIVTGARHEACDPSVQPLRDAHVRRARRQRASFCFFCLFVAALACAALATLDYAFARRARSVGRDAWRMLWPFSATVGPPTLPVRRPWSPGGNMTSLGPLWTPGHRCWLEEEHGVSSLS